MALAKIERENAAAGKGCLGKAADDEPVFILRAQDMLAPALVEQWANTTLAATAWLKSSHPPRYLMRSP